MTRIPAWRALALGLACAVVLAVAVVPAAPSEAARLHLHRGSHGAKVRVLETRLNRLGLLVRSAVDRHYRQATVRAVKSFQRRHRMHVNGRVDARTWTAIARAVTVKTAPKPIVPPPPEILGHRGAMVAGVAENTLQSMQYAAGSADVLEFDLRFTSDGQIVLMHDPTLDRTTNCTGRVIDWTFADLRADCTVSGQPIPTFDEVAAYAASVPIPICPQIAPSQVTDANLADVVDVINHHGLMSRTYMQSFVPAHFPRLRALAPRMRFVYLSVSLTSPAAIKQAGGSIAGLQARDLTSQAVAGYKRAGLAVWAWTASTTAELVRLRSLGVNGVFTNIPRQAAALYHPS